MRSRGIQGPSYRFLYGNTREMRSMIESARSSPQELSHHAFLVVQPHIYSWLKLYGPNFTFWLGSKAQLVVTETEMIRDVLNNKNGAFPKAKGTVLMRTIIGDGLANSKGEKWLKMRKLANHAFHGESLRGMIPAKIASVEMMLERWRNHAGKEIEVYEEFKLLTSEIISRTAFGSSYLEGQHIFEMLKKLILIGYRSNFKVRIPIICKIIKTHDDIEAEKLEQGIRASIIKMVKEREEKATNLERSDNYGDDFLGVLIRTYHDSDKTKKISIDELIDECKTFYIAGQETSTNALSWIILLLAMHTDWQDKARKEVLDLFGHQNPNTDKLGKMNTMAMIINESLRLYSPTVFLRQRKIEKEVKLGKLILPAGIEVLISTLAVHHNPDIWGEDVHLFKPERFAEGVAKATKNNTAALFPIGLGPRKCVGVNFAIMEIKVALSMILQRYKFTLSPTYVHSPTSLISMFPKHGVHILLQPL